jgi:hypothetical protein
MPPTSLNTVGLAFQEMSNVSQGGSNTMKMNLSIVGGFATTGPATLYGITSLSNTVFMSSNLSVAGAVSSSGMITGAGLTSSGTITALNQNLALGTGAVTCGAINASGAITATNKNLSLGTGAITCGALTVATINGVAYSAGGGSKTGGSLGSVSTSYVNVFALPSTACAFIVTYLTGAADGTYGMHSVICDNGDNVTYVLSGNNMTTSITGGVLQIKANANSYPNVTWSAIQVY